MKFPTTLARLAAPALAVLLAAPVASAQDAAPRPRGQFAVVSVAVEAVAGNVALPASTPGTLTMSTCAGCAPKSFQATVATRFVVKGETVSLAQLHAAMLKNPNGIVTVNYIVNSGVVTEITTAP
ncbi:MAG: hypothetical protein CMLOHMNK_01020 [Steroidobacteraceae bacterium]|nr:hypothetical protein [Steroidobacteraceae bacterium]